MNVVTVIAAALGAVTGQASAAAGQAEPDWQLLFADPPEGAVYLDRNSTWSRGDERAITARFTFTDPAPGEVAEIITRIEVDCTARNYRAMTAAGFDRAGQELYAHIFSADRAPTRPDGQGSGRQLVDAACTQAPSRR